MNSRSRRVASLTIAIALPMAVVGCMSIERMAPPVEGRVVEIGVAQGHELITLQRGRHLYLTTCIKCHTVEPVDRYSPEKWRKLMPDMIEESKLDSADHDALMAYVLAAHAMLSEPPADAQKAE